MEGDFCFKGMDGVMEPTWKHFTKPNRLVDSFFSQPAVGHAMFHVFKQRQATKSADQVAHQPIKLRFVD